MIRKTLFDVLIFVSHLGMNDCFNLLWSLFPRWKNTNEILCNFYLEIKRSELTAASGVALAAPFLKYKGRSFRVHVHSSNFTKLKKIFFLILYSCQIVMKMCLTHKQIDIPAYPDFSVNLEIYGVARGDYWDDGTWAVEPRSFSGSENVHRPREFWQLCKAGLDDQVLFRVFRFYNVMKKPYVHIKTDISG